MRWQEAPDYAAFCALSGLPRLAGTRVDTVPAPVPYLHADPARIAHWADRLDGLVPRGFRRIGVIWAGRPTHNNDRNRSAQLADFAPLTEVPGIALLALQKGPRTDQAGAYYGRAPLINIGAEIADYDDTMAILENLDLLVTVDTSVGASGWCDGTPGVDHAAARARLALAARSRRTRRGIRARGCSGNSPPERGTT